MISKVNLNTEVMMRLSDRQKALPHTEAGVYEDIPVAVLYSRCRTTPT